MAKRDDTTRPADLKGKYINCPHCGRLLKVVRISGVYHEGTDPGGNANRWFEVWLSDGYSCRFWEKRW